MTTVSDLGDNRMRDVAVSFSLAGRRRKKEVFASTAIGVGKRQRILPFLFYFLRHVHCTQVRRSLILFTS